MQMTRMKFFLPLVFLFSILSYADSEPEVWEKIYDEDGIIVARKDVPGQDTFAFKATAEIAAPLMRVASVLIDIERRNEWMPNLANAYIVEVLNDAERVEYFHVKTPFILKDRDFVVDAKARWDKPTQTATFSFSSIVHPKVPLTSKVRGELYESKYILKSLGEKTAIELNVHVDPKGSVPKWIVNLFQKDYPRKTLERLKVQCVKPDIVISPLVTKVMGN